MDKKYIERPELFNQKEYNKEYKKNHYKSISISVKPDFATTLNDYCQQAGFSKTELIVKSVLYCIDNNIELWYNIFKVWNLL